MRRSNVERALAVALTLGVVAPAYAADLDLRPTIIDETVSAEWNGFYAGVQAGIVMSRGGIELDNSFGFLIPLDIQNGLFFVEESDLHSTVGAGLTAGYNYQMGDYVVGIEGDITFTSLNADHHRERIDPNPIVPFFGQNVISDYRTQFENIMTLRLRAGRSYGNTLYYATGGLAGADVRNSFSIAIPGIGYASPTDWASEGMAWGFAVGAGAEHKLAENISVKVEALYIDLQNQTVIGRDPVSFAGEGIDYEFKNNLAIARVGMNVHF